MSTDSRVKAEQLRESIASRAAGLRRDARRMAAAAARPAGQVSLRGVPSWVLAAAVGAVAGLLAAFRRHSRKP